MNIEELPGYDPKKWLYVKGPTNLEGLGAELFRSGDACWSPGNGISGCTTGAIYRLPYPNPQDTAKRLPDYDPEKWDYFWGKERESIDCEGALPFIEGSEWEGDCEGCVLGWLYRKPKVKPSIPQAVLDSLPDDWGEEEYEYAIGPARHWGDCECEVYYPDRASWSNGASKADLRARSFVYRRKRAKRYELIPSKYARKGDECCLSGNYGTGKEEWHVWSSNGPKTPPPTDYICRRRIEE